MSASFLDVFNHTIDRYPPIVPPTTVLARAIATLHSEDNAPGDYLLVTEFRNNYSHLLGLLTEREAIAFMASHQDWSDRPVSEAMREAIAYPASEIVSFQQLLSLFRQYHSSVIPLIDKEGILTGTIVREQIWQAMETHFSSFDDRQATQIKLQQTEIALKASESRYWEIIEAQTELICRFLPDSTLTFVNEAYCHYFHSSKRDLIGKPFLFLMPKEEQWKVRQILQALTPENPVITAEYQALRPDGSIAWQQWTDRAIFDRENNLLEYQAVGRDISDRVFAEEALRRSEEELRQLNENLEATVRDRTFSLQNSETRFRSLFEQAAIGITLTTLTGQYIAANQKFCDLLGYSVTEILKLTWKQLTHPEDLPLQQATQYRMLAGEIKNYSLEQRYLHRNGEIIWLNLTHSVVCDCDNIPQYTLSMVEDIRDRKQAWQVLEENRRRQELHNRILTYVNKGVPVEQTLQYAIAQIGATFSHLRVIYATLDEGEDFSVLHQYVPPNLPSVQKLEAIFPYLSELKNKQMIAIADVTREERLNPLLDRLEAQKTRSLLYIPLQYSERAIGLIGLHSPQPHEWTQSEKITLTEVGDYLTVAIQEGNSREELKQQKEFLQAIFDSIPVMLILFDREGRPQWVNRAWKEIVGWSLEKFGDRDIIEKCYPDPEVYRQFRDCINIEDQKWQDFKTRVRDGVDLDISWASVSLSDGRIIAIGQDISDRKRAAAQLQAIQERFEYLIASSPAVIYSCSADNESFPTTFISENIKDILGYSARDWLHDPNFWLDRLHPEDSSRIATNMELLFSLGHHIYEYRFLHQDGNYRWLRDEVKLIRDEEGNPLECIGSIIEIGDRKQTEAELRKSEERYRAIVQDQTELICRYRVDGTLIFVNDAYCRYFQQSRQDIIDRKWLPDILPEDLDQLNQQYSLLRPENPVYTCEIRTLLPNGAIRVQQWIDRGLFNTQGELIEIQAVGRDISDRKQAENDIRHALEKERELSELKSNFISIASHEFRTPLTVIIASAKLQKHYSHRLSEEQKQQQLDRLLRASDRILQLLNDILILGRAEAGKIELSPTSLNLKDFCLELLVEIQAIDEDRHNIIFGDREKVDFDVIADENLLRYILTNLLSNAIKYSPQNTPVMFNVAIENCEVIFQVEDRGLGIPSEDIPHLFESFHRGKNVGEIKGTGLGLAIVKRAIELYEGAIDIQSKINEGTIFTVTLPLLHEN